MRWAGNWTRGPRASRPPSGRPARIPSLTNGSRSDSPVLEKQDGSARELFEGLSDKEVEAVNRLSRGIVNKLLHGPLSHLRKPGSNIDEAALKLESFRGMFDLNE